MDRKKNEQEERERGRGGSENAQMKLDKKNMTKKKSSSA